MPFSVKKTNPVFRASDILPSVRWVKSLKKKRRKNKNLLYRLNNQDFVYIMIDQLVCLLFDKNGTEIIRYDLLDVF